MLNPFGWAGLGVLALYLAAFFWGGTLVARAAGRPVWLFSQAKGRDRLAAVGFQAAFALAFAGPLVWLAFAPLHKNDPLWMDGRLVLVSLAGLILSVVGAMLAFAAQMSMGASWRVGVRQGETGALVQGGLFRLSRNPTFLGQLLLLAGLALAIPSLPTLAGVLLFFWSAQVQIRSEEQSLSARHGADYDAFACAVPRWIGLPGQEAARPRIGQLVLVAMVAVAVDQATKAAALRMLDHGDPIAILPVFNLALGFNEGASFGMLGGLMAGRPLAMVALTGVVTLVIALWALRTQNRLERTGLAVIVGGSLGNIVDRLRNGAVTDFLDFYWKDWHWPAFNMADVAIFCGAVLILLSAVLAPRRDGGVAGY